MLNRISPDTSPDKAFIERDRPLLEASSAAGELPHSLTMSSGQQDSAAISSLIADHSAIPSSGEEPVANGGHRLWPKIGFQLAGN